MLLSVEPLKFVKLLAHDLRWQMIQYLAASDYRVHELTERVDQPMNLVSYHLKKLRDAGIVVTRRSDADGRDIYYTLDLGYVKTMFQQMGNAIHPALIPEAADCPEEPLTQDVRILVLCAHNSSRSQIAVGLFRHMGGEHLTVFSAGSQPTGVHSDAIKVMADRGINIQDQTSNHIQEYLNQRFDYVITVCDYAREICPKFGDDTIHLHWGLPDPASIIAPQERVAAFNKTLDQLELRISYFLRMLAQQKVHAAYTDNQ